MIAIVLVSATAFGTFSFAARTNSTGTHHTTASTSSSPAHSFIPQSTTTKILSQITTNPVAHNTTLKSSTSTDHVLLIVVIPNFIGITYTILRGWILKTNV
jgi:hypothetical protein